MARKKKEEGAAPAPAPASKSAGVPQYKKAMEASKNGCAILECPGTKEIITMHPGGQVQADCGGRTRTPEAWEIENFKARGDWKPAA